jgi:hypothetical protein
VLARVTTDTIIPAAAVAVVVATSAAAAVLVVQFQANIVLPGSQEVQEHLEQAVQVVQVHLQALLITLVLAVAVAVVHLMLVE